MKIQIFKFDNTYIRIILINFNIFKIKFKYMKIRIFKFDNILEHKFFEKLTLNIYSKKKIVF